MTYQDVIAAAAANTPHDTQHDAPDASHVDRARRADRDRAREERPRADRPARDDYSDNRATRDWRFWY